MGFLWIRFWSPLLTGCTAQHKSVSFLPGTAGKAAEPLCMEWLLMHRGIYDQFYQRLMDWVQGRFSTGFIRSVPACGLAWNGCASALQMSLANTLALRKSTKARTLGEGCLLAGQRILKTLLRRACSGSTRQSSPLAR